MIYTITTIENPIERIGVKGNKFTMRDTRTIGYARLLCEAEEWVLQNAMDMCEGGFYPLVVIEAMQEGLYPMVGSDFGEWWYAWDGNKYVKTRKPTEYKNTIGFAMG